MVMILTMTSRTHMQALLRLLTLTSLEVRVFAVGMSSDEFAGHVSQS